MTDRARDAAARACRKCASVFVIGGAQLAGQAGGAPGDRSSSTYVPKSEARASRSTQLEERSPRMSRRRAGHPLLLRSTTTASATLQLIVTGPTRTLVIETAAKLQREMATIAASREPALDRARSTGPRSASRPKPASRGRARRLDRRHRRDGAGRDHRRHRRQPRQVQRRRPADADPGAAARERARRPSAARAAAGADDGRRRGAALLGRRHRASARGRPRSTATTASGASRSRRDLRRHRRARRGAGDGLRAAGGEEPAGRRHASSETGDAEIMGEVFAGFAHGDGRRPDDGARRARSCCSRSFFQPFTILLSLPLSIGGAILALVADPQGDQPCRW